ncbi:pyridoxamine 5'-phosphate oxidase family protein [Arthrobacter sp. M4]|uniref:pyridoxamine 5'-phosphate oxidase family protein n=1 Tax=Arthrobacter sp. M4 TaxID=218160 RepID=UPI001CDB777C|nr:pyridoxamine 5'-phosphate oxidase family protein [Arthrobacter sp. M4]MCA4134928.1 pyridoxamine 5'-phosphate oxidase family protein [Arthrobacter sp. M4]
MDTYFTDSTPLDSSDTDANPRIDGARHTYRDLDENRCWELLGSQSTGRFGFVLEGRVMILPVNYLVHNRAIYFRTASRGSIGEAVPHTRASFQVDASRADLSEGWSVLASGSSSRVEDPELLTYLWGRTMPEPWAGGERNMFICLTPTLVTGRQVFLA